MSAEHEAMARDGRLWVTHEVRPEPGMGYHWFIEGIGPRGFNVQASGVTSSRWGANRKLRGYIRRWRKELRPA